MVPQMPQSIREALKRRGRVLRMDDAVVANVTGKTLRSVITGQEDKTATVNTDDYGGYRGKLKGFARHDVVNHSADEYARRNPDGTVSHVNSCESFFSLFKRGVIGSWHHVSREHLPKYASEFEFRWNTRKMTDGGRMAAGIPCVEGKRLMYRQPGN